MQALHRGAAWLGLPGLENWFNGKLLFEWGQAWLKVLI
jgi:hypothetical protein